MERKAVEALAVEGRRSGLLSGGEMAETLGLSVYETDAFLKSKGLLLADNLNEIDSDASVLENLLAK